MLILSVCCRLRSSVTRGSQTDVSAPLNVQNMSAFLSGCKLAVRADGPLIGMKCGMVTPDTAFQADPGTEGRWMSGRPC